MRFRVLIQTMLPVTLLLTAAGPVAAAAVLLDLQFRDQAGQPLPVRAGVFVGPQSQARPPQDPAGHVYQDVGLWSHFCCDGFAQVYVPSGPVTVRAGCGFEYHGVDTTLTISSATTLTLTLNRFVDMNAAGWYSGDTHVHITHQPQKYALDAQHLLLAMQAEDLNYANSMEEQANFTGSIDPASLPDRIIHFSKEERNAHFSHLSILGLKQWIPDQGCAPQPGTACGRTLDAAIHALIDAQPGETAVIATHPFCTPDINDLSAWPGGGLWRAMSIDLPAGAVDAMDLLTYTNDLPPASVDHYFRALNAGFRLPPSAGTDCVLATGASRPLAGYRTYVRVDGAFTMDAWIAGLKAGRSFVSNYPLFTEFNVGGAGPGDVLSTRAGMLHGSVSVTCGLPVQRIEIIGDAGTLQVIEAPGAGAKSITASVKVRRAGLTWLVARASGSARSWHAQDAVFAQTAPVYLADNSPEQKYERVSPYQASGDAVQAAGAARSAAAIYFMARLDEVESLFDAQGDFPLDSRAAFDAAVAQARDYYDALLTASGVTPVLRAGWEVWSASPNPFGGSTRLTYRVPAEGGSHGVDVYDATGRVVRRLFSGARPAGDYQLVWDGRDARGSLVASGVYFVRVSPATAVSVARKLVLVR